MIRASITVTMVCNCTFCFLRDLRDYTFLREKNHINYKCETNTTVPLVCNSKSRLTYLNEFLIYVFGRTVCKDAIL